MDLFDSLGEKEMRILLTFLLASVALSIVGWSDYAKAAPPTQIAQSHIESVHASDLEITIRDLGGQDIVIGTDSYGDPEITANYNGLLFTVLFYQCDGEYCNQFQFRAGFETDRRTAREVSTAQNTDLVFGKGYVDGDGDAVVELAVSTRGGVTMDFLYAQTELWFEILTDFGAELGY
jgi:hypothetical protein